MASIDNNNIKKTEAKTKGKGIGWAVIFVIAVLAELGENLSSADEDVLIGVIIVIAVIAVFIAIISKIKKSKAARTFPNRTPLSGASAYQYKEHNHDRFSGEMYHVSENSYEHYKVQLDGFLKAGIIEKEEYGLLLRRILKK